MATAVLPDTSPAGPSAALDTVNIAELSSKLYEKCRTEFPPETSFRQSDLEKLNIIPKTKDEVTILAKCATHLTAQRLFRILQDSGEHLSWKVVPRDVANK